MLAFLDPTYQVSKVYYRSRAYNLAMNKMAVTDQFTLEEMLILVEAIGEWRGYLNSVDPNRKDIDPEQLQANKEKAKELSTKLWTIKCKLADLEYSKSKA